jgi:hypothetical protein
MCSDRAAARAEEEALMRAENAELAELDAEAEVSGTGSLGLPHAVDAGAPLLPPRASGLASPSYGCGWRSWERKHVES